MMTVLDLRASQPTGSIDRLRAFIQKFVLNLDKVFDIWEAGGIMTCSVFPLRGVKKSVFLLNGLLCHITLLTEGEECVVH